MNPKILFAAVVLVSTAHAQTLTLTRTIPLPGATGKLDHSSVDVAGARLFISAWGINAVKVVDLKQGVVARTLEGMGKPQGILYVPELKRLYVASEELGALLVLDGATYAKLAEIKLSEDTDNIRYDAKTNLLYVGTGDGELAVIDAAKNSRIENVPLKAHPEAFALEKSGSRVLLNLPNAKNVTVYDRIAKKITAEWPMHEIGDNFTMTLDEANHRTFVGARKPPLFLVYDTPTGREVARLPLHGNTDDFHYDAKRKQIYASCGEGFIDVFTQIDADHYVLKEAVKTAPGGRTSAFDGDTIYLNVQDGKSQAPEVRCYAVR